MEDKRKKRNRCDFCKNKEQKIDYKDIRTLQRFVSDKGKIYPARVTGNCAKHQRQVTRAIKRAREIALMPYTNK
mgnify:CR=1 FL=1